ncbi:MAG: molybdenum cofactor guanylyltransferase [Alphaproteobacteria bacterium]|nr:molybdenum cofactor guanylyltransferase [Alphaproteobacteria bacterium]
MEKKRVENVDTVAGIVLAGGQSSRMGRNKALLVFRGLPLVEHMQKTLAEAGIADTYISGTLAGYDTLPDREPLAGPARAMARLLQEFSGRYNRLLFIPVDMPFMSAGVIRALLAAPGNVFIKGHPLPNCLLTRRGLPASNAVKGLLEEVSATALEIQGGHEKDFLNLNTPEDWERAGGGG